MKETSELEKLAKAKGIKVSKKLLKIEKFAREKGMTVNELLEKERENLSKKLEQLAASHRQSD